MGIWLGRCKNEMNFDGCRMMTRLIWNQKTSYTLDSVLREMSCPLLLIWGELDPWVGPGKAVRIKELYPGTSLVKVEAGHCPHDEAPEVVNKALLDWLSTKVLCTTHHLPSPSIIN